MSHTTSNSVTGRDGYIMAKALYWAIRFSQSQPDELREWSDEDDMKALLQDRFGMFGAGFAMSDASVLALYEKDRAAGKLDYDFAAILARFKPVDLEPDPRFIEEGNTSASPVEFAEEGQPASVAHQENRNDLNASLKALGDAVRNGTF